MADAVSQRQHAVNGILRWQDKKKAAEELIAQLSTKHQANDTQPSPQVVQEQISGLSEGLAPVFGVSQDPSQLNA
jgi:hypothetical protein